MHLSNPDYLILFENYYLFLVFISIHYLVTSYVF